MLFKWKEAGTLFAIFGYLDFVVKVFMLAGVVNLFYVLQMFIVYYVLLYFQVMVQILDINHTFCRLFMHHYTEFRSEQCVKLSPIYCH